MIVQYVFILCMLAQVVIGFYCAAKLTGRNPFWVRFIVLLPALAALATIAAMARAEYVAFLPDILRSAAVMLIYALVASRFSSTPWLDIRTTEEHHHEPVQKLHAR